MQKTVSILEKMKAQRKALGLTQGKIAMQAEMSLPTYRALENGSGKVRHLEKVCALLGLQLSLTPSSSCQWPKDKTLTVLSLFDGIACGIQALKNLGIQARYFASEIDKTAISIAQHNHPDITQLGDITNLTSRDIKALGKIDLVLGGSPCTGFSTSGKMDGFQENSSALFSEFVSKLNLIRRYNPDARFLFENVVMKMADRDVVSRQLNVEPVKIDAAVLSGQSRKRLYWSNWQVPAMDDRGIVLGDVLCGRNEEYSSDIAVNWSEDAADNVHIRFAGDEYSYTADAFFKNNVATATRKAIIRCIRRANEKSRAITAGACCNLGGDGSTTIIYRQNGDIKLRVLTVREMERLQGLPVGYTAVTGLGKRRRGFHIGNGWQVSIIEELLRAMPSEPIGIPSRSAVLACAGLNAASA